MAEAASGTDAVRRAGVRVKICGVTRAEDARVAADAGADFIGAILAEGFGRTVAPELAATYGAGDRERPRLVGVLVDPEPKEAIRVARVSGATVLQLHGEEPPPLIAALRGAGDWRIWKAVRVGSRRDVLEALDRYAPIVDGLLLDGGRAGRRGGGHGERFPWSEVEPLRDRLPDSVTLIVAGGLDPEGVAEVVERLRPDVVDVSSGVERRRGVKNAVLVRSFVRNARRARR